MLILKSILKSSLKAVSLFGPLEMGPLGKGTDSIVCLCGWFSKIVLSLKWYYNNIKGFLKITLPIELVLCVCNILP